jgi:hypothetical protein
VTILQPTPPQVLELIDRLYRDPMRRSELGVGWTLYEAAVKEQLTPAGDIDAIARCVGELVTDGLVTYRTGGPPVPGLLWGSRELQQYYEYRPTAAGQEAASRVRQDRATVSRQAVLERHLLLAQHQWLGEEARAALEQYAVGLDSALGGQPAAAIGAAKELLEAACRVVLAAAGTPAARRADLPELFQQASNLAGPATDAGRGVPGTRTLNRSLIAAVQGLAEMRNAAGSGHGRSEPSPADARHARLAAGIAVTLTEWLLSGGSAPGPNGRGPAS